MHKKNSQTTVKSRRRFIGNTMLSFSLLPTISLTKNIYDKDEMPLNPLGEQKMYVSESGYIRNTRGKLFYSIDIDE